MPGGGLLVRREPPGADAGHPVPATERDRRHQSLVPAPARRQHVLHDQAADPIRCVLRVPAPPLSLSSSCPVKFYGSGSKVYAREWRALNYVVALGIK